MTKSRYTVPDPIYMSFTITKEEFTYEVGFRPDKSDLKCSDPKGDWHEIVQRDGKHFFAPIKESG